MRIIEFEADHNRTGTIDVYKEHCHVCNKMKEVLAIDSSAQEYGPGFICLECINRAFNSYYKEQQR